MKPTQEQLYWKSHRDVNDALQQAAFMCGMLKSDDGKFANHPLNHEEIKTMANANRPYSASFQTIAKAKGIQL
jgi:hypothetical protein